MDDEEQLTVSPVYHGHDSVAKAKIDEKAIPATFRKFQERQIIQDLKENVCLVPQAPTDDGAVSDVDLETEQVHYELPDGTKVKVEETLSHIPGKNSTLLPFVDDFYWSLLTYTTSHTQQQNG